MPGDAVGSVPFPATTRCVDPVTPAVARRRYSTAIGPRFTGSQAIRTLEYNARESKSGRVDL